jgi:pimeloyl-ACP methyl ester carboxylesterase
MPDAVRTRQVEANGLTFTIDEVGEGDAVALFLHGFPECRQSWAAQLPVLAAQGWRAVAPDLRGYGQSSRPKARDAYHLDHLVADVAALFDTLGARRRLLIAHDWGAVIAWAFALEQTRPLDGLVIMNVPHPSAYLASLRKSSAQWRRSWYVLFFQLPWLPEALLGAGHARAIGDSFTRTAIDPSCFTPQMIARYRDNAAAPGALTAMINYYRANGSALGRWAPGKAPMIEVPILIEWGERDPFLGADLLDEHAGLVRDLTIKRFPNVGHWVQQEAAIEVNAALVAWMAAKGLASA